MRRVFVIIAAGLLCLTPPGCGGEKEYKDPGEVDGVEIEGVPSLTDDDATSGSDDKSPESGE